MKKEILEFITNVIVGFCLGLVIDFIVKTSFIFTVLGTIAGLILALILRKKNKKE